jgi:autophagy-related protein 2
VCKFRNFNVIKLLQTFVLAESGIAALDSDPTAELSRFHIRLSSLAIVLLHDDILTLVVESDGSSLARSSVQQMKGISKDFFDELGLFAVTGYGSKDFQVAKEAFLKACQLNHIRHVFSLN